MREECGLYEFGRNMLHEYYSQTLDKILLERRKKKYFLG